MPYLELLVVMDSIGALTSLPHVERQASPGRLYVCDLLSSISGRSYRFSSKVVGQLVLSGSPGLELGKLDMFMLCWRGPISE